MNRAPYTAGDRGTSRLRQTHGPLPLLLCGIDGCRNGWRETPYLPWPAPAGTEGASGTLWRP